VRIWDAETGAALREPLEGHTNRVTSVAFSPHVTSVAFSPHVERIVSGSEDNTVRIWDAETGAFRTPLKGHTDLVTSITISHARKAFPPNCINHTICPFNVDAVTNGPPLQCSCPANRWGLLHVGSSSTHTFSMDSSSIPVP
jgi:hypothetical protein